MSGAAGSCLGVAMRYLRLSVVSFVLATQMVLASPIEVVFSGRLSAVDATLSS